MAKNSITDYDNIANNNTDIQSVDIAEGCAPSGINNAIREMMADLADVNDGTVTLTSPKAATLDVTGNLTVDTNTLYVDSTNNRVGIGTISPSSELHIASGSPILTLQDTDSTEPLATYISFKDSGGNEHGWVGYGSAGTDVLQVANAYDDISFYTGTGGTSAPRMTIGSSGNVGIGTSSPSSDAIVKFIEVQDNTSAGVVLDATRTFSMYSSSSGSLVFRDETAATSRMTIDSSGNVGIATSSPATLGGGAKLTVNQAADGNIVFARGGSTRQVQIGTTSTTGYINADNTSGGFAVHTNGTERMRIDGSGRVGIGTSSPAEKLVIEGSSPFILVNNTDETRSGIRFADAQNIGERFQLAFDASNAAMCFDRVESTGVINERMRIDGSGNVGINTVPTRLTSNAHTLNIKADVTSKGGVLLLESSDESLRSYFYPESAGTQLGTLTNHNLLLMTNSTERMRISNTGAVSIAASSGNGYLSVPQAYVGTTGSATNMHILSSGVFLRSVSSGRYKTGVEDAEMSYAEELYNLRPVYYKSLGTFDNPDHSHWGFIAEEVAEIDPRLCLFKTTEPELDDDGNIQYDDDGNIIETTLSEPVVEGVQYDRMIPLLLMLLKTERDKVETLQTKVAALETQNADFETRIATLETN